MDTIDSINLEVEIQSNGIIRNKNGKLIARLDDGVDYNSEHISGCKIIKCACGQQDILGGAEVEIGGVCHRPDNPCYIIHNEIQQPKKHENHFCANNDGECICDCFGEGFEAGRQEMKEEIIKWAEKEKYDNIIHQLDDSEEDDKKRDWCIDYDDLIKKLKEK